MLKKRNSIIVGILLISSGICLIGYNFFLEKRNKAIENIRMEYLLLHSDVLEQTNEILEEADDPNLDDKLNDNIEDITPSNNQNGTQSTTVKNNYIGYLNIPSINLTKGFVSKNSKYNTIKKNIMVLNEADYPDVNKGNFILVAHSGSAYISFFKNLYKLKLNDFAYVTYNNKKYTYQISDIYDVEKTGTVQIKRNRDLTTLTLITCTKSDDTKQTVYIAYLTEIAEG